MSGTEATTTLKIKVNAREVGDLEKRLKETFKAGSARDLTKEFERTLRSVQGLTKSVRELVSEVQKDRSDGIRKMSDDLADARKEAQKLREELDRLNGGGGGGRGGGGGSPGGGGGGWFGGWFGGGRGNGGDNGGGGGRGIRPADIQAPMPTAQALSHAMSGIPGLGAVAGGAMLASYMMYGSALQHQTALRDNYAWLGGEPTSADANSPLANGFVKPFGVGEKYGLSRTQTLAEMGGLSRAAGRTVTSEEFDAARGAQTWYGVGLEQTGGLMHAGKYLGAGQGSTGNVARLIGQAVAQGMQGSEIGEYLSRIQGLMQKQVELGQKGDMGGVLEMERRVRAALGGSDNAGSGIRASSIVESFAGNASAMAMSGSDSPEMMQLMRLMGYTGSGGFEEYAKYSGMAQDPKNVARYLPQLIEMVSGPEFGEQGRAFNTQKLMARFGTQVGWDDAMRLSRGIPATARGAGSADLTGMGGGRGAAIGILTGEAEIENKRIDVGYKAAKQVQNFNDILVTMADTAQTLAGPAVVELTEQLKSLAEWAQKVADEGVFGSGAGAPMTPAQRTHYEQGSATHGYRY